MVLMALVATPRGYLHHCELAHHHPASGHATVLPHCNVCDEALPVSTAVDIAVSPPISSVFIALTASLMVDPALGHVLLCSDRGPPSRA